MSGVGQQRHRTAPHPGCDFDQHEADVQHNGYAKGAPRTGNPVGVFLVIMVMMAMAPMVVNPGAVVVRAAHACPFRRTVAHLPQCSNNR